MGLFFFENIENRLIEELVFLAVLLVVVLMLISFMED